MRYFARIIAVLVLAITDTNGLSEHSFYDELTEGDSSIGGALNFVSKGEHEKRILLDDNPHVQV